MPDQTNAMTAPETSASQGSWTNFDSEHSGSASYVNGTASAQYHGEDHFNAHTPGADVHTGSVTDAGGHVSGWHDFAVHGGSSSYYEMDSHPAHEANPQNHPAAFDVHHAEPQYNAFDHAGPAASLHDSSHHSGSLHDSGQHAGSHHDGGSHPDHGSTGVSN